MNHNNKSDHDLFYKAIFAVAIGFAGVILFISFMTFYSNQKTVTAQFNSINASVEDLFTNQQSDAEKFTNDSSTAQIMEQKEKIIDSQIKYLENLVNLHNQMSSSQLMVFVYGFLSSVLIGVATSFLSKGEERIKQQEKSIEQQNMVISKQKETTQDIEKRSILLEGNYYAQRILGEMLLIQSALNTCLDEQSYKTNFFRANKYVRQLREIIKSEQIDITKIQSETKRELIEIINVISKLTSDKIDSLSPKDDFYEANFGPFPKEIVDDINEIVRLLEKT